MPIAFPCSSLMLLHVVTVPLPATPVETGVAEHHASAARAGKPGLRRQLAVSARAPASGRAGTGTG
ncbi:arsenite efflux pump ArsB [Cupriavidus sp. LEh25]|nr:arsenite efflux pump ArsB [Cupriavidus sp. LEh25]